MGIGIGGGLGPFRLGISTKGIGGGIGPLSVGGRWPRMPRGRGGSGIDWAAVIAWLLVIGIAVVAVGYGWPVLAVLGCVYAARRVRRLFGLVFVAVGVLIAFLAVPYWIWLTKTVFISAHIPQDAACTQTFRNQWPQACNVAQSEVDLHGAGFHHLRVVGPKADPPGKVCWVATTSPSPGSWVYKGTTVTLHVECEKAPS